MDHDRIAAASDAAMRLKCAYRLTDVVDARPTGDRAGGLSANMFVFADAPAAVRKSLTSAGFATDAGSQVLELRILRLYMNQVNVTKVPVAVYEVELEGQPPFLIRSQVPSMNWNGTQDEAYRGYARAIEGANRQLIEKLNAGCAG